MDFEYLKGWKEKTPKVLLVLSAVLALVIAGKVLALGIASMRISERIEAASVESKQDPAVDKSLAKGREAADELKKKNLFAPSAPNQKPVRQVTGILGDEALIDGKWYKVGDKIKDATIVAIEPAQIRIEWEGKETVLEPINAKSAPSPKKPTGKRIEKEGPAKEPAVVPQEEPPVAHQRSLPPMMMRGRMPKRVVEE